MVGIPNTAVRHCFRSKDGEEVTAGQCLGQLEGQCRWPASQQDDGTGSGDSELQEMGRKGEKDQEQKGGEVGRNSRPEEKPAAKTESMLQSWA